MTRVASFLASVVVHAAALYAFYRLGDARPARSRTC